MSYEPTEKVQQIPRGDIILSGLNPRKKMSKAGLNELAQNIRERRAAGMPPIIQPLTARPVPNNGHVELVCGERRFKAAAIAGLETVPVIVRSMTDTEVIETMAVENVQRANVHPLHEGLGYRDLMEKAGYKVADLALKFGKDERYIFQRLTLASLTSEAQDLFERGGMYLIHAQKLAKLQPADQTACLAALFNNAIPSPGNLDNWIKNNILMQLSEAPFSLKNAKLLPQAGSCVSCPKRTGNAGMLWDEIKQTDRCTDPACFQAKQTALLDEARAKLTRKKTGFVEISENWNPTVPGAIKQQDWHVIHDEKDKCKLAKPGLMVEPYYGGRKLGAVIDVCADHTCKKHWAWKQRQQTSGSRSGSSSSSASAATEAMRATVLENTIRMRTLDSLLARFEGFKREDLEMACRLWTKRMGAEKCRNLWKLLGWNIPKGCVGWPPTDHLPQTLAAMTETELWRYLFAVLMIPFGKISDWESKKGKYDDALFQTAARYSVPTEAIVQYSKNEQDAKQLRGNARKEALDKLECPDPVAFAAPKLKEVGADEAAAALKASGRADIGDPDDEVEDEDDPDE